MQFREATVDDISQIQEVRHSVKENVLSNPALVTNAHCIDYITRRGKGWVCEADGRILGFAVVDLQENNIWALFIRPEAENKCIGKTLHNQMLRWYFSQQRDTVWLSTSPNTRAEGFYRRMGWIETGTHGKGELKFEMSYERWRQVQSLS
jgi:GNAT superfamily N-acetyltransferase